MPSEMEICSVIAKSGFFDAGWYLAQNPDIREAGVDPILHYVRHGEKELRQPSPRFDLKKEKRYRRNSANVLYDYIVFKQNERGRDAVPVVFALNDAYAPYLSAALESIKFNMDLNIVYKIYVLYPELEQKNLDALLSQEFDNFKILPVDMGREKLPEPYKIDGINRPAEYYKLIVPDLFNEHERILYLDCDIILSCDIYQLYKDFSGGAAISAAPEFPLALPNGGKDRGQNRINAGVLLYNTKKFAAGNARKHLAAALAASSNNISAANALNSLPPSTFSILPPRWNMQWHVTAAQTYKYLEPPLFHEVAASFANPSLVHFSSEKKPLNHDDGHFSALFWKYAKFSPFYKNMGKPGRPVADGGGNR